MVIYILGLHCAKPKCASVREKAHVNVNSLPTVLKLVWQSNDGYASIMSTYFRISSFSAS